jgi:DNA-binding transcriptional LysR family regulator
MRFDLTDLRLFVNVHEAGTLTGGAERSHMTLASASERVRAMEDDLGVPLLVRERRGVSPTPAGRTLLHHARRVLGQMARLRDELGEYGAGLQGQVRMLCNTSALSEHLPGLLASFLAAHPGLSVDLEERPSEAIVDAVRNELCDLGVVSDAADLAGLQTFAFRPDPLALVVPKGHALASRRSIALAEVLDHPFVGLAEGSALQEHLSRHARRLGRRLSYRIRLRSFEAVCRMVGHGVGLGIVPQAVAARCARSAGIRRLRLTDPWALRQLVICMRDMEALPSPSQSMVRHLLAAAA